MRDHVDQKGLTGGFLLLQNFSVAISVSPAVSELMNGVRQHDPRVQQMSCNVILKSHYARQSYDLDIAAY